MIGIADVPVEILHKVKSQVHSTQTEKVPSISSSPLDPDTNLDAIDQRIGTARPRDINQNRESTTNATCPLRFKNGEHHDEGDDTQHLEHPEPETHNITICSIVTPRQKHLMNPRDRAVYRAVEIGDQGISNLAITVIRPPMDLILALSRGCHNALMEYGDDTIRPLDEVNDFKSGVVTAGKQFGLGWYDGITGVVMQPYRGASKNGAKGFMAGLYRGASGLILKPSAGKKF